ncbi:hypothetical protein [Nonomuraea jabiensis]|uniref:Sensor domain-containing protein n=1 Tax=Nonomuraea jabiensis TaxID=882448 RepID=A0A7W9GFW4_9ACTN|nr:hypothetical protein [Nonomuraea jabiensis]MBB5783060.1 hypothetical protein [Nonomuraea jabiensis]
MHLSAVRAALSGATVVCAMLLTALPATAAAAPASTAQAGVDRGVLLTKADQPPVSETYGDPWVNPYFEPDVTGPTCWEYGRDTGASAGLSARFSTPTWFHSSNDVWVFPSADAAAAFERQWRADLATCVDRNPPAETGSAVFDITRAGEADGVEVLRVTAATNPYSTLTYHFWVAVVRQGRAVYAVQLLDYRHGDPQLMPFDATVAKIKAKLAAYYP